MISYAEGVIGLTLTAYVPGDIGGPFEGPLYASEEGARAAYPAAIIWPQVIETRSLGEALTALVGIEFESPEAATLAYSTVLNRLCV